MRDLARYHRERNWAISLTLIAVVALLLFFIYAKGRSLMRRVTCASNDKLVALAVGLKPPSFFYSIHEAETWKSHHVITSADFVFCLWYENRLLCFFEDNSFSVYSGDKWIERRSLELDEGLRLLAAEHLGEDVVLFVADEDNHLSAYRMRVDDPEGPELDILAALALPEAPNHIRAARHGERIIVVWSALQGAAEPIEDIYCADFDGSSWSAITPVETTLSVLAYDVASYAGEPFLVMRVATGEPGTISITAMTRAGGTQWEATERLVLDRENARSKKDVAGKFKPDTLAACSYKGTIRVFAYFDNVVREHIFEEGQWSHQTSSHEIPTISRGLALVAYALLLLLAVGIVGFGIAMLLEKLRLRRTLAGR